ncbi:hypothetical protein GCM10017673_04220 [Streptosporangium violaceochromogenes]|nr:hypothetical protein GCM10017673_04220 [Streptosporangium violaceochromogenes]
MTYTIVAVEHATGSVGLATASHSINLLPKTVSVGEGGGRTVVVASQAFSSRAAGERCVAEILSGADARAAVAGALAGDAGRELRQVAVAESGGGVAAFTGDRCVSGAGDHVDETAGFAVAGNMLAGDAVLHAMAEAFLASGGAELPVRLLRALAAGSAAGGDFRGDRAAGLVVRGGTAGLDLRTDEHADPVARVHRLYRLRADTAVLADCYAWYAAGCPPEPAASLLRRLEAGAARAADDDLAAWAEIVRRRGRLPGAPRAGLTPAARRLVHALAGASDPARAGDPIWNGDDEHAR